MPFRPFVLVPFCALALGLGIALPAAGAPGPAIQPALEAAIAGLRAEEQLTLLLVLREQADIRELDRSLSAGRATRQERHRAVVTALQDAARRSQAPLLAALDGMAARGEIAGYTPYWISNLIAVRAGREALSALAERPDIAAIERCPRAELIAPVGERRTEEPARGIGVTHGLKAIRADQVWRELGLTGRGILVANMDTGVDGKHPALAARWRGAHGHPPGECWLDVLGGHPFFPADDDNHGTHVMGTITGLGTATGDTIGVAWNALWIATNVIGQVVNPGFSSDVIAGFEWFADPDGDPETVDDVPHVIQNSWGVTEQFSGYEDCDDRWWAVIDNCEAAGAATTWSAGNYGPNYYTMASPADRISSPWNTFSVGAIDATNFGFPYPIAGFSSRGPSGCDSLTLKPEVVAPGVDVYSSIPEGRYAQSGWSGTSMAGPHVAGTIALLCEANPDLTIDEMKEIVFATAIDLGRPGEDHFYGKGVIDAYAACLAAIGPTGTVTGFATNASNGGTPVPGVQIGPDELSRTVPSQTNGSYRILLPPGGYTFSATHPSFVPDLAAGVVVTEGAATSLSFSLIDIGAPRISATTDLPPSDDPAGPYEVETRVEDFSAIDAVTLFYRVDGGAFQSVTMSPLGGGDYRGAIPGQPFLSEVEYYVQAVDVAANSANDPGGAPYELYGFPVVPIQTHFADDIEGGENGWTHLALTPGFTDQWNRNSYNNHTPGGSWAWKCGQVQGWLWYADSLDAALVSPSITIPEHAELRFWHWVAAESSYAFPGCAYDGGLVEILPAGGDWEPIHPLRGYPYLIRESSAPGPLPAGTPVFSGQHDWREERFDLSAYTGQIRVRFHFGSDGDTDALAGWYIDDVRVISYNYELSGAGEPVAERGLVRLRRGDPNPFFASTTLRFDLPRPLAATLTIFDPAGRAVRRLVDGVQPAGAQAAVWDGRDERGRRLPSGVYLARLDADGVRATRRLILAR